MQVKRWNFPGGFGVSQDQFLLGLAGILYGLQLLLSSPSLWAWLGIGTIFRVIDLIQIPKTFKRLAFWGLGVLVLPMIILQCPEASHAVLLDRAQTFFVNSFSTGAGSTDDYASLIDLIFNAIRGVYIIILAVAGFQAWQDFRQQEEMSAFARIIFGSLVVIFSIDVISTFIVPAA